MTQITQSEINNEAWRLVAKMNLVALDTATSLENLANALLTLNRH